MEIVANTHSGAVITPPQLNALSAACAASGLILAIDETLTAIRCGAPFAYQRHEYATLSICPDLVFFGKALGVNGTGINFGGGYLQRLGIKDRIHARQAIIDWQNCVTQAVPLPVLIDALGVLEMAVAGDWIMRSRTIGGKLRKIVVTRARHMSLHSLSNAMEENAVVQETEVLGGIDSFLFVHIRIAGSFLVMGASNPAPQAKWVRWLPRLDKKMMNEETLESIFSTEGANMRRMLSDRMERQGMKPVWCFWCGNRAINREIPWCRTCCIDVCDSEQCLEQLVSHTCLS